MPTRVFKETPQRPTKWCTPFSEVVGDVRDWGTEGLPKTLSSAFPDTRKLPCPQSMDEKIHAQRLSSLGPAGESGLNRYCGDLAMVALPRETP